MRRFRYPFGALLAAAAVLSACGGENPQAETPAAVDPSLPTSAEIPVEALPDPLPEPYLFRDTVTIERETQTETLYVVQPGDTLADIAASFCITAAEIQRLNTIVDPNTLSVGDELRIPIREGACGGAAPPTAQDSAAGGEQQPAPPERPPGEIYVVQPGDTLADIANVYGFSWADIAAYNNLSDFEADNLTIGQELVIPPPPSEETDQPLEDPADERSEPPG